MLEGVRENEIIVGAYTDRDGGICPMLAAHRQRRAHRLHHLRALLGPLRPRVGAAARAAPPSASCASSTTHLEASLLAERPHRPAGRDPRAPRAGRAPHGAARRRRRRVARPRPGDADRAAELARRAGWAWLRPFRRLDDYERALARVEAERDALRDEVGAAV